VTSQNPAADHLLPVDPQSGSPLDPRRQPGYYPGFSTLDQRAFWDAATRQTVMDRVEQVPAIRFFDGGEAATMQAICNRILPQDDRDPERRIPVLNYLDNRLYSGMSDGYRYEDMPADGDAFRLGIQAIDEISVHLHAKRFTELEMAQQEEVLETIHDAHPPAGGNIWKRMPVDRFWLLLVQDIAAAYYAHPWSWDEIGFGGPAYPRGYVRLENGKAEPWEKDEQRYEWEPPPGARSGGYRPVGGGRPHHAPPGQSGTH